jgi:hypothetical protein
VGLDEDVGLEPEVGVDQEVGVEPTKPIVGLGEEVGLLAKDGVAEEEDEATEDGDEEREDEADSEMSRSDILISPCASNEDGEAEVDSSKQTCVVKGVPFN